MGWGTLTVESSDSAVLTSTHNFCFNRKLEKKGIPISQHYHQIFPISGPHFVKYPDLITFISG